MNNLSNYAMCLGVKAKEEYSRKIEIINGIDPYALDEKEFNLSLNELPRITIEVIMNFFIFRLSETTQTEIKSYKSLDAYIQFLSKWIEDIRAQKIGNLYLILGKVLHSQRVSQPPAKPWLIISERGEIVSSHCTCIAGLGQVCTHTASILFALEFAAKEPKSVTDVLAYWIGPKSKNSFYKKLKDIDFTLPNRKENNTAENIDFHSHLRLEMSPEEVKEFLKQYREAGCESVLHKFFCDKPINCNLPDPLPNMYNEVYKNLSLPELQVIAEVIDTYKVSKEQAELIETETRKQNNCNLWFLMRAGRITASNFRSVCHTKIDKPSLTIIKNVCYPHLYKKTFKAGIYGCEHEQKGIDNFIEYHRQMHPNATISKCGLFINDNVPHFAASPDGLFECDICGKGCVEIKCPYCARDSSVQNLILSSKKMCLTSNEYSVFLNRNHAYYFQVQMQMAVTGYSFCFFVVWSPNDFFYEKVSFDENFWNLYSSVATDFFKKVIIPELLSKHFTSDVKSAKMDLPITTCKEDKQTFEFDERRIENIQLWCYCQTPDSGGEMVLCGKKSCKIRFYHRECIGLNKIPKKWLCKHCK